MKASDIFGKKKDSATIKDLKIFYKCHSCGYPVKEAVSTGCSKCGGTKYFRISEAEYNQSRYDLSKGDRNG